MNEINILKNNHLSMFEEKRANHKKLVADLFVEYTNHEGIVLSDKWSLFCGFYHYFANNFPAEIYDKEYIVGTNWHWRWRNILKNAEDAPHNHGHFIPDFPDFLKKGVKGKIDDAHSLEMGKMAAEALIAFSEYISRYSSTAKSLCDAASTDEDKKRLEGISKDCANISQNAPQNFRQALQLVWFIMCFLETETSSSAISLGRADIYLYPYYKKDVEDGVITRDLAKKLIMAFYIKVSEGNESCMLTLGGDKENELTILFLEAQTALTMRQPSISVRISDNTDKIILDKAKELVLTGCGMPAYFNDKIVINGLMRLGYTSAEASDYGIVGCYEAAPCGCYSNSVAGCFYLYDSFNSFLDKADDYKTYDEFYKAFQRHFEEYYKSDILTGMRKNVETEFSFISPFTYNVLNLNYRKFLCGINILGIGILIDSLYKIKKLVYDEGCTTVSLLKSQAENDFTDENLYKKILSLDGHFGSNTPESNTIAGDVSSFIGRVILDNPIEDNVITSPSLFWFTTDIYKRNLPGNVNGRRSGELLSYGVMPCATPHKDNVTSVLLSSASINAEYFPDGCPTLISLNKKDVSEGDTLLSLIKSFFEAGGFHIAINLVDSDTLKKAKANPTEYSDIMVKISGYSTRFTGLCDEIQDAVIERA